MSLPMSRVLIRGVAVAALVACWIAPAAAQRGKWWQDERFESELGLTTEQSANLEAVFQKTQPHLRQRMRALNRAEAEFDRLVESGDDASVLDYVGIVEAARAELNKTRTLMLLRMRRSLTTEQWAKFTALADEGKRSSGRSSSGRSSSGKGSSTKPSSKR
ncbi:MAG: Spy/CpxP family protein refolding chaperone [Acidobacteria bacterium]|nr:Spy/CpxP family protein refolding chaperone [Acidobacteriota bacterium]